MPIITSSYNPPIFFRSAHFNTIYKTLFYTSTISYTRKRIPTPDNDFIDLDFSIGTSTSTLVITLHGLEGSSNSSYIKSAITLLNSSKIDCVSVNFRGCSGEDNNQPYSYNSGKTDDLEIVVNYILSNYNYKNIILLGYSMGGNIALKYLGESTFLAKQLTGAITVSVPCDLAGSSNALSQWSNSIYMYRFMKTLKEKSLTKMERFPDSNLDKQKILAAKDFKDFDNAVTAPLFGFENAEDYWKQCSSTQYLKGIQQPTLILNAKDDSFLSESCYPYEIARNHKYLSLEIPSYGGHVGFNSSILNSNDEWLEQRIYSFIKMIIS